MTRRWAPDRGDIVWIGLDPRTGHEQSGRRPAIVLSPRSYNTKVGLALACPITSRLKGYPFEVELPDGLAVGGAVLSDQVKSVDWRAREADLACKAPDDVTLAVLGRLSRLLETP